MPHVPPAPFGSRFFSSLVFIACSDASAALASPPLPPPVPGYPIGWCIRAKPDVFADAKSAGFEHVELALQDVLPLSDDEFTKLAENLQALKLRALSGYNSVPKEIMIVGSEADVAKQDEHLRRLIERAALLSSRTSSSTPVRRGVCRTVDRETRLCGSLPRSAGGSPQRRRRAASPCCFRRFVAPIPTHHDDRGSGGAG
jgi:hypothetical protein